MFTITRSFQKLRFETTQTNSEPVRRLDMVILGPPIGLLNEILLVCGIFSYSIASSGPRVRLKTIFFMFPIENPRSFQKCRSETSQTYSEGVRRRDIRREFVGRKTPYRDAD